MVHVEGTQGVRPSQIGKAGSNVGRRACRSPLVLRHISGASTVSSRDQAWRAAGPTPAASGSATRRRQVAASVGVPNRR